MNNKEILVSGYPKSGNTWLARLTAELLGCPVKGFYQELDSDEIAIEGLDRESSFVVLKGHQTFQEIQEYFNSDQILYIVRDPRDIAVSGANYYHFRGYEFISSITMKIPKVRIFYYRWLTSFKRKLRIMLQAMIKGRKEGKWLSVPWNEHVEGYLKSNCLILRYEDLLLNPHEQCKRILAHLKVERSKEFIDEAIRKQSFSEVKKKFSSIGNTQKAQFLVHGKHGTWRQYLTCSQESMILKNFNATMKKNGYI